NEKEELRHDDGRAHLKSARVLFESIGDPIEHSKPAGTQWRGRADRGCRIMPRLTSKERGMQFDGDRFVPLPPEAVWPKLSDAVYLAGSLADVEVERADQDFAAWKVRPRLAFAAGTLDVTMAITDRAPPPEI